MKVILDTTSGTIELSIDGGPVATLTAAQAHQLIDQLAAAAADLEQVPPAFDSEHVTTRHAGSNWAWYCAYTNTGHLLVALRHPTLGWVVNALPNLDAIKMGHGIEHQVATSNANALTAVLQQLGQSDAVAPKAPPIVPAAGSDTMH